MFERIAEGAPQRENDRALAYEAVGWLLEAGFGALRMAKAQVVIGDAVLQSATRLFDVGGASALQENLRLDRHWRNARTLASHNPVFYKARVVGDHALNGIDPTFYWNVGARTD